LTAADNGTGYIELSTDSTGVAANITIGAGNANTKLGFVATQNDTGFNMIPESKLFIISVDGGANVSLNFTPTNTTLTAAQVAAQIQAAVAGLTAVDNGTGYIELTSNTTGLGSNMTVGAGNANSVLGFSASQSDVGTPFMDVNNKTFYVSVNGVDYNFNFTPTNTALSADNVSTQINNAVFAAFAADNGTGYIELVSNITGADSNITIGDGTANDVLGFTNTQNDMGMNGTWVNAYTYILRLYANDTNSVTSNENYTITIDNDNPVVSGSVFSDADDLVTSSTAVVLNVTASDAISPISTVTAGVVGTEVSMSNVAGSLYTTSTTNASALGCSEGSCVVKFVATDSAENVNNTHTYTFTVDDTNPALSGATISDADDEVRETDTIQVNVTVTDSNGVSTVSVNGQSMNHMGSNIYNYTGTALSLCGATDGTCTLTFLATDNALRTNTLTYNLTTDDTNPVISSVTISDSYVQDTTSVSVTVAVTDAHTSVASVTAEGTTLIDRGSGIWNGTISLNDTAVDAVNVLAIDNVGNRHTLNTTTYTIDDSAPTYASSSLTDDYVTNATQVQWLVNVLDSNLSSYTLTTYDLGAGSISGSSFVANNVTLNLSVTLTAETKNVTLVVIDGAENTLTLALINGTNFTVDDANPIVNSVAISDDYIKSTQSVTFTVNVSGESNTSLASVTAEGNALAWTGTAWVGTGTTDSDEVINVSVTDKAGNVGTHSSSVYTVDNVVPVFTVVVPLQGYNYTNAAGNITINFTLTEANVSIFNVSIDGTRNYTGTTAGTHTNTFVGLRTGWHNATFRATDEAGNLAVVVRKSFRIVAPLNVSQAAAGLNTSLGARNVSFSVSNVSVTGNGSLTVDDTTVMTMDMEYNLSGTEIDVQIPEFDALDASWENTFTAETNESSGSSVTASGNAGSTIQKIVLFKNASGFLSQSDFTRGARITFKQAIQGLDILYLDDDEGNTVYKLSACTSVPTSAITTSNMCYVNTTTNVTLYIPHFSGGAIANDTAAPAVTITSVSNSSTIADSSFWINFTANEANPHATTFCNYTLNNGSVNTYSNVDIDAIAAEMSSVGTAWSYSQELYTLVNGTYTLTVVCKDANLAENSTVYALTVADSTAPIITATGPSGDLESSSSTYTATLSATTDEKTLCRYSETSGAYASMTEALGSANTYATTHTESISHTEDEDVTYYIACTDKNGNEDAATVTYSVDVTERSSSSDNTVVTTTPGLITYSKSWLSINAGEEKITAVDRDGMAFTQVVFTAKNDISSASMTLKVLTGAPTSTGAISKEAYQYIQLLETNFDSEDITNAKINFKVEKSWLTSKGLSENNVALYRYVNGKWVAQTTEMKASDVTHVFYEANVGGFSYFAIGQAETEAPVVPDVVPAVVVPEVQTPPPTGDVVQEVVDDQETTGSSDESKMSSGKWLWVAIVIVVVIILAFLFFREGKIQLVGKKAEKEGLNKTSNVKSMNDFIEKQLAAGHKKSDVKAALLQVGWPKDKVEEALKKVK
jgi:PGF-pre-PGF domain-containing protein